MSRLRTWLERLACRHLGHAWGLQANELIGHFWLCLRCGKWSRQ